MLLAMMTCLLLHCVGVDSQRKAGADKTFTLAEQFVYNRYTAAKVIVREIKRKIDGHTFSNREFIPLPIHPITERQTETHIGKHYCLV